MTTNPSAARLLQRWDAQQTAYIRHRAARFDTIARVVALALADRPAPRVLDLAGGPGSLGLAVLEAVPHAALVIADKDPVLTAIARDVATADNRIRVVGADLTDPAWTSSPEIADAPFDAIVSSTALHWLQPTDLVNLYLRLPALLSPGGVFLNGDHLHYDPILEPLLSRVSAEDTARVERDELGAGADDWDAWWTAALDAYPDAARKREQVWGQELHIAPPKVTLEFHLAALRSAGLSETGTVWRYLDDHVLYAVKRD